MANPWATLAPALAIAGLSLAVMLMADACHTAPEQRRRRDDREAVSVPILKAENISVAYRRPDGSEGIVVWQAGFSLEPGTILGLVGESGCGKSTLAAAAIGFHPPGGRVIEGSARFEGNDLLRLTLRELRDIWGARLAYVSQNAGLSLIQPSPSAGRSNMCLADISNYVVARHESVPSTC